MPYVRCWIVNILITFKVIIVERKQKKKKSQTFSYYLSFCPLGEDTLTRYLYDFLLCYCTSVASHQDNTFAFYYYYSLVLLVAVVVVVVMVMVMLVLAFTILMSSSVKSIKQKIKKH